MSANGPLLLETGLDGSSMLALVPFDDTLLSSFTGDRRAVAGFSRTSEELLEPVGLSLNSLNFLAASDFS